MPRILTALLLAALLLLPILAAAQTPTKTVSLDVTRGDLHAVVAMLEKQTGIKALVQDGSQPYRLINIHLQDASVSKALRCIAFSAGARETQNADGVYVFAPMDAVSSPGTASQPHAQGLPPPLNAADLRWHSIILRHAHPADTLNFMHWGEGKIIADTSNLPTGVACIFALQSNNSLLVQATDAGYAQVKEIVSVLDIVPMQVQIKVTLAAIPLNAKSAIDLTDPAQVLRQLRQANAIFCELPPLITNDGDAVRLPAVWPYPGLPLLANYPSNGDILALGLQMTPHLNTDSTVTLTAASSIPMRVNAHTVHPGSTAVFEVTGLPQFSGYRVFLFVTPTILPPSAGNVGISIAP